MILSRGSIMLISRGLRGGSYFKLIRDPPCDSYETCQESKGRGLLQLVKRKNFYPGVVCCLGRAASQSLHWSQWTETADTTCVLSGSIFGAGKSIEIRPIAALWLLATGRAGRPFERSQFWEVFRTQNWVRRSDLFCRWFCFLLGQAGCISVAAWTQLKVAFYYFVSSGGLIVCCWKKAHQPFAALGDCLKCFLLLRVCGFSRRWRLPFEWLYWILYCPLLALLAPLDSYRSLQPRKNINNDLFSQSRY